MTLELLVLVEILSVVNLKLEIHCLGFIYRLYIDLFYFQVRIKVLRGHLDSVQSCTFIDNDKKVLTASHDRNVKLWDFESGENLHTYQGHSQPVSQAQADPFTK